MAATNAALSSAMPSPTAPKSVLILRTRSPLWTTLLSRASPATPPVFAAKVSDVEPKVIGSAVVSSKTVPAFETPSATDTSIPCPNSADVSKSVARVIADAAPLNM
jgi:hypothetical protein